MDKAPHVYAAISAVTADLSKEGLSKDRKNTTQNYAFRGIDDVYNVLAAKLAHHGLCILPRVIAKDIHERQSKSGGTLFYTTLTVEFDFVAALDGSKHTVCTVGEAMDSADKSSNKAMSAAYKYACLQAFCIPTEGESPDADAHHHEVAPRQAARDFTAQVPKKEQSGKVSPGQAKGLRDILSVLGKDEAAAVRYVTGDAKDKIEDMTTEEFKALFDILDKKVPQRT
jgi:hypothetical protein